MNSNYRSELDGIKGILITILILYHANISLGSIKLFRGGFFTIDIIFVLIGYFATNRIITEYKQNNNFSLINFYKRRFNKILPLLSFVILTCLVFGYFFLLPEDLVQLSKSSFFSILSISNIYFWVVGYEFSNLISLKVPLFNIWSLSVIGQFYLLFPLLLLFLLRLSNINSLIILILILVLSYLLSTTLSKNLPSLNFYFLPSRFWEFLTGSVLAILYIGYAERLKDNAITKYFSYIGILLILVSTCYFDNKNSNINNSALIAVIGISIVIIFINQNIILRKILRSNFLTFLGSISFSLFLWHYPVFAFSRILNLAHGNEIYLALIIFVLSVLTNLIFEKGLTKYGNKFLYIFLSFVLITTPWLLISNYIINKDGKIKEYPKVLEKEFKKQNYMKISQDGVLCHNRAGINNFCTFNKKNNNTGNIILLGDSLVDSILTNFIEQVKNTNFKLIHASYSGNLFLPDIVQIDKTKNTENQFDFDKSIIDKHLSRSKLINEEENNYIVIFGNYANYFIEKKIVLNQNKIEYEETPWKYVELKNINVDKNKRIKALKQKFYNTLKQLTKENKVFLVYPVPQPPEHAGAWVNKKWTEIMLDTEYYQKDKFNYKKDIYKKFYGDLSDFFNELNFKNLYKIKTEDLYCLDEKCIFYDNNNIYFKDSVHLSYFGSKILINNILPKIESVNLID